MIWSADTMVVYFFGVVTMDFFSHEIYEIYLLGYCQDVLINNFFKVVGVKPCNDWVH